LAQGSTFSGRTSTLFVTGIFEAAKLFGFLCMVYSDDTIFLKRFKCEQWDEIKTKTVAFLDYLQDVMIIDQLKVNMSKTNLAVLSKGLKPGRFDIQWGNDWIREVDHITLLGVTFSFNMRFDRHIKNIAKQCWITLRYLYQLYNLEQNLKLHLIKSLVLSKLDYANTVLIGCNQKELKPLVTVSRAAIRYVCGIRKYDSVSMFFISTHVLPMHYRLSFCALTLIHRIVLSDVPNYLLGLVEKAHCKRNLRSSYNGTLVVMPILKNIYTKKRLAYYGKTYNDIDKSIRVLPIKEFSKRLKTLLFELYKTTI
jgi:hypothetical protein